MMRDRAHDVVRAAASKHVLDFEHAVAVEVIDEMIRGDDVRADAPERAAAERDAAKEV